MNDIASSDTAIADRQERRSQGHPLNQGPRVGTFTPFTTQTSAVNRAAGGVLTRTVAFDIVPRLLLAHRAPATAVPPCEAEAASEVAEMTALILAQDVAGARLYAEAILARGLGVDALMLDLLAPSARLMGTMWVDDTTDFTSVSLGVWRLHQLMHDFSPGLIAAPARNAQDRRVLLTPMPGEQHGFGIAMVAAFFRQAGWQVVSSPLETQQDLTRLVRSRWFAVVGISLSWSSRIEALATAIRAVRRASRNPAVGVMVGGSLFEEHPELVRLVGADATAMDARSAPGQAAGLVSLLAGRD